MSYKQMSQHGNIWIEQLAYIEAQTEIARAQGCADAQAAEIKYLREIAGSVSILASKIQEMDAGLQLAREKREKPVLQVGWYYPARNEFCTMQERRGDPDFEPGFNTPVYAIAP